jgi:hypothetical protein
MPTVRRALAIGVVNNEIYAIGGYNGSYLPINEEYTPWDSVVSPNGGEIWPVGVLRSVSVSTHCLSNKNVYLSVDGGYSWQLIAYGVLFGGGTNFTFRVPHVPTRFALIKVCPTGYEPMDPDFCDVSDSFFTIQSTITLLSFSAEPSGEGVKLTWDTDPGVPDIEGYNLYVSDNPEGPFEKLNSEIVRQNYYIDKKSHKPFLIYRLGAVNGWGREYIIGEKAVTSLKKPLFVYPSVFRNGGWIMCEVIGFNYASRVRTSIEVYNISGQRVRTIVNHALEPGFYKFYFDGRDNGGKELPSGKYVVLMKTPDFVKKVEFMLLK